MKHVIDVVATLLVDLLDPIELAVVSTWGEKEWHQVLTQVNQQVSRISSMQTLSWDVEQPHERRMREQRERAMRQQEVLNQRKVYMQQKFQHFHVPPEANTTEYYVDVDDIGIWGWMPAKIDTVVSAGKRGTVEVPIAVIMMAEDESDIQNWIQSNCTENEISGELDWSWEPDMVDMRNPQIRDVDESEFESNDGIETDDANIDLAFMLDDALTQLGIDPEEWRQYDVERGMD